MRILRKICIGATSSDCLHRINFVRPILFVVLLTRSGEEPWKNMHRRNLVRLLASDQCRQTYLHRINFVGFARRSVLPRLSFVHFASYFGFASSTSLPTSSDLPTATLLLLLLLLLLLPLLLPLLLLLLLLPLLRRLRNELHGGE